MEVDNSTQFITPPEVLVQPQIPQASINNKRIPPSIIIGFTVFLILVGGEIYSSTKKKVPIPNVPPSHSVATVQPTIDPTANWKPITIDTISFKYPTDFHDPEFVKTPFGQSAEIKSENTTQRIVVISGINQGHSEKELSEYIDGLVEGGGQRLFLDNNEAVINKNDSLGQKVTTVYITAKDNKSQYSISIQSPESFNDKDIDILLNRIFYTLKFE